jgi:hypothetical protein
MAKRIAIAVAAAVELGERGLHQVLGLVPVAAHQVRDPE